MKTNTNFQRLGYPLFLAGALAGLLFTLLATWADFEATNFDVSLTADAPLPSLRCPVLLAPQETGTIRASFDNPMERQLTRRVRILISRKLSSELQEGEYIAIPLSPGETQTLAWEVGSENLVWGRMILARVWQNGNFPLPSRSSSCGVLVADVFGLPGAWATALAMFGSPILMVAGVLLWERSYLPDLKSAKRILDRERAMKALAAIIAGGLLATWAGQWMLAVIMVIVATLLIVTVIGGSSAL
jgi:hypothetical protein